MEKISVLCSADNNYAAYCGIMLTSLYESNKGNEIEVYLLTEGLKKKEEEKFRQFEKRYNTTVNIITVGKENFKHCPVREGDHVSLTAYFRIACEELLPEDIHRILYLDCDIMVKCDLRPLWNTEIADRAMGVVLDGWHIRNENRLSFKEKTYFNSGVLLINLDFFRANQISKKCMDYIHDFPDRIILHDQDVLNIICHDNLRYLPLKYNFQTSFLCIEKQYDNSLIEEIHTSIKEGNLIVHFDAFPKPWNKNLYVDHPYSREWRGLRKISLWSDARLTSSVTATYLFRVLFLKLMWKLGIRKRPKNYII